MRRLIVIVIVVVLGILCYSSDFLLYTKKVFLSEPTTHTIEKGEYLSKIAQHYYGNADYWRELALINRAPDSDVIFPGEEIVIPTLDVIKQIRNTRWLSKVNRFMNDQENILAVHKVKAAEPDLAEVSSEPVTEPVTAAINADESGVTQNVPGDNNEKSAKSSVFYIILAAIAIALVAGIVAFIIYRRKNRTDTTLDIDDIDFGDDKGDSEPDYDEYLKKKERERELILN